MNLCISNVSHNNHRGSGYWPIFLQMSISKLDRDDSSSLRASCWFIWLAHVYHYVPAHSRTRVHMRIASVILVSALWMSRYHRWLSKCLHFCSWGAVQLTFLTIAFNSLPRSVIEYLLLCYERQQLQLVETVLVFWNVSVVPIKPLLCLHNRKHESEGCPMTLKIFFVHFRAKYN